MSRILEFLILSVVVVALCTGWLLFSLHRTERDLRVTFLSVGEGDAILIADRGVQVLIDGGVDGKRLLERLGVHIPFYDRTIEVVLATHPDADHIGGLPAVFERYRVPVVLTNGGQKESGVFDEFARALREESGSRTETVGRSSELVLPSGARLTVLAPDTVVGTEANEGSIVSELVVGERRFVFLADAPVEVAERLVAPGPIHVLKVAHHGGRKETSKALLARLLPEEAVISVGKNRYGHPAKETLAALSISGVPVFRTDERGDITYVCTAHGCAQE